ncbi:MAG: electron transport complex subunit RsxE [Ruminococcus sp.]|nr:electron transport complex subunit RsxE [Ruminococcus sp.]
MNKLQNFSKGLIKENPVLVLVLGTCPTLATSTSIINALGMGAAATVVLLCSNMVISALRKIIPDKVRIPCYIVLIAGFVTMVQMLVKAFAPALDQSLGIYLPLIVVNCIILGRAEMFANKNTVIDSAIDALGMGAGFTLALSLMALIREVFGIMIAVVGLISKGKAPYKKSFGCEGCPNASICNVAAGQTACGGKDELKEGGEVQ